MFGRWTVDNTGIPISYSRAGSFLVTSIPDFAVPIARTTSRVGRVSR